MFTWYLVPPLPALLLAAATGGALVCRRSFGTARRHAGIALSESMSPVERLEMLLHPWVGFAVMPIFALANAGVVVSDADLTQPVSVAIFAGLVLGKPIGKCD